LRNGQGSAPGAGGGAKVTLSSQQPRLVRNTVTMGRAPTNFFLPDAVYSLKIDVPGFKTQTVPEITIASSASVTQDVALAWRSQRIDYVNALTLTPT